MDTGETPWPTQTADRRRRSVSKQAQQSFPRFRMIPRGVRLSAGNSWPSFRASNTEEKNGKLVSTKSAQLACSEGRADRSAAGDLMADTNNSIAKKHTGARHHASPLQNRFSMAPVWFVRDLKREDFVVPRRRTLIGTRCPGEPCVRIRLHQSTSAGKCIFLERKSVRVRWVLRLPGCGRPRPQQLRYAPACLTFRRPPKSSPAFLRPRTGAL